jgi:hypothetical protein
MQFRGTVGFALFVDQQWEGDAGVFPKMASVVEVAQADRDKPGALARKSLLVFAQLRDVLAAEDSAVVTKEHNYRWRVCPKRAQLNGPVVRVRQSQACQPAGERFRHAGHSQCA